MLDPREVYVHNLVAEARNNPKTLLLVDNTPDEYTHQVLSRSSDYTMLDARVMHRKKFIRNSPLHLLLEEARHMLVYAMLRGKTLVIRLAEVSVDFNATFCDENCNDERIKRNPYPPYEEWAYIPRGFMINHGALLRQHPYPFSLLRKDDLLEIQEMFLLRRLKEEEEEFNHPPALARAYSQKKLAELGKARSNRAMVINPSDLAIDEIIHPDFRIIITTTMPIESIPDMLFNGNFGLPSDRMADFHVVEVNL